MSAQDRPTNIDELACWVNCWGDERKHQAKDAEWHKGYQQAISDTWALIREIAPGWLATWQEQTRERRATPPVPPGKAVA